MKSIIINIGRAGIVVLITVGAVTGSLLVSFVADFLFGLEINNMTYFMAFLTPLIIAPAVTWYVVGLTIKISALEEKMRGLATYDELTRVMNRRAFLESCESLLKLMNRNHSPLSLAYLDIDDFKKINDAFGHSCGDEILKTFCSMLKEQFRESDLVGRLGGEEFCIALPDTNINDAVTKLDKVRQLIMNTTVQCKDTVSYTVSIGVCEYNWSDPKNLDELLSISDKALYKAKNSGKNCVISS